MKSIDQTWFGAVGTCNEGYEKSKQGDALTRTRANNSHEVSDQSVDEWLSEYSRHDACLNPSRR